MSEKLITKISFEEISEIWHTHLWPNRISPIETHSAMTWPFDGTSIEYDMDIFNYKPSFYGVYVNKELIGVNSGHRTKDNIYRSRGIWVHPAHRRDGIAKLLFSCIDVQAGKEGCNIIWSIPRKSAIDAYTSAGFETVGNYFDEGMEFGPNIYVMKEINLSNYSKHRKTPTKV